jgi:hypothetical protein
MLTLLNNAILALADPLLNWLLRLPADVALILVAVGTGAILTFVRPFTTDQDRLRRCDQDKRRLRELMRQAKRQQDREALLRYRSTRNTISMTTLAAEGLPLLVALVPITILGTWCFQRLAFVAPHAGDVVPLTAYFPVSAAGGLAHVVPQEGIREVSQPIGSGTERWIQEIVAVTDPQAGPPHAVARWQLLAEARAAPYMLEIRYKTGTYTKELLVGQNIYSPPVESYGEDQPVLRAELGLRPVQLCGVVPGIEWLGLPPWLVAYFLLAIPSVSLLKRLTGIH